ncbi:MULTISPECIES: TrkH family potassium uptake protein [Actinomycetes]|uniref:TrkH family potassium uptake protein n=1 Tax=Nocardia asteroides TaxID=1824 RepID=UPI0003653AA7|nr:potassium transporter TrkG [Nocardia asteroides]UGT50065.1 TrkH family potassium uptake protein [Nocardia asteroides]
MVVFGFGAATLVGTLLLMLPVAAESRTVTAPITALFTAVSAVCVTGLVVVDTESHWSLFGELVILGLIQIGGLGIMTLASLLGLLVARRMGLRMQLIAASETKTLRLGESRRVVIGVIRMSLAVEAVVAVVLSFRFIFGYDQNGWRGVYLGVFHAISAYNNAGFGLYQDSLMGFATDPWIIVPITVALVIGGLGFPVVFEVTRSLRRRARGRGRDLRWSLHTRITLITYFALALVAVVAVIAFEWTNPGTLGPLGVLQKLLVGGFHGFSPRTAGFNSVDVGAMHSSTLLVNDVLMFIGGGSAGTAGGIKVTTFALLAFVIVAEVRGEPTVHIMDRRLAAPVQRQAITVALLGVGAVVIGTLTLLTITGMDLDVVLFEVVSAFGTVGLSTGITADIPGSGQLVLIALMFLGRLGPITLATALALRDRGRRYELPEERPIVG